MELFFLLFILLILYLTNINFIKMKKILLSLSLLVSLSGISQIVSDGDFTATVTSPGGGCTGNISNLRYKCMGKLWFI